MFKFYLAGFETFIWEDNTEFGDYTRWAPGRPGSYQSTNDRCIAVSSNPSIPGKFLLLIFRLFINYYSKIII